MSDLQAARAEIAELKERLAQMEALIEWFKKQMFGSGKGEKQDALQMRLKLEELEQAREQLVQRQQIAYERKKPESAANPAERFEHLPVKEQVVIEPEEVKADPDLYVKIGEERGFEVDITPPKLFKREIVRPKYKHRIDRSRPPIIAPAPKRVIDNSYASAGLIAWVLLSKYRDHLPLYRQEKMFKRWNGSIARQTLCDWVGAAAFLLEGIYATIKQQLLQCDYLQADETPIKFIDPDRKRAKASTGYFWLMGQPGGYVYIEWNPSRGQDAAEALLGGFKGLLQIDGYSGYNQLSSPDHGVTRLACLAHCRRKFADAAEGGSSQALFMLRLINQLYHLDNQWERAGVTSPRLRAVRRQQDFTMTLTLLKKAATKLREKARPASTLGQACSYLLGQWEALVVICDYGQAKLDNNLIENAVRPTALGKKNWLFVGHPQAGKRSAVIYTLLLCCERFGIDPHAYFKDLLSKLPNMSNQDDLEPFLPHNWSPPRFNQDPACHKQDIENVTIDV